MENEFKNLEKLMRLLHEVQRVKRAARRPEEKEKTNTAEHTFELSILCWYLVSVHKLELNIEKVLKFALAHDIIEAYAGDTPIYDEEAKKTKIQREADALLRLEREFPEFSELTETIHEYESRSSQEAKFVYATDKLVDPLSFQMEKTQSIWKDYGVSFETLLKNKSAKIATFELIEKYWKELVKGLEKRKSFYFNE